MRILLTGGTGNIGSRLVIPLTHSGNQLFVYDLRDHPLVESSEFHQAQFIRGDLADQDAVFAAVKRHGIESIFHLGAVLGARSEEEPEAAWQVNIDGTRNVLEAARRFGVKRLIFSSTLATYGGRLPDPLPIDAPQWPVGLYGVTKVAGERLGVYYHHRFGLDFRALRMPAVVCPRGSAGASSAYCSAVFEDSVLRGWHEFWVKPSTRVPMVYVPDAVRALLALHDAPAKNLTRRVYNIAGIHPSAEELASAIWKRLPQAQITYKPDPQRLSIVESWPPRIDDSDARRDWGWNPGWDLEQMSDDIIEILQRESQNQ